MELDRFRRQQHLSAQHYMGKSTLDTSIDTAITLIARLFHVPMAQVNVLDDDRQVTIAAVGTPLETITRDSSFCRHVVEDGLLKTLADLPTVPTSMAHIKAYAGVPLMGREGLVVGSLCLLDTVERHFTEQNILDLQSAAELIQDELELMRRLASASNGSTTEAMTLMTAIDEGQIVPFFQPIVDLQTGRVHAVEALARWHHPVRGLLYPDSFLPLAEDSEIIIDLDLAVLRQAATKLATWRSADQRLQLHVNPSARHFDHLDCLARLQDTVQGAGVPSDAITFELTETAALAAFPDDRDFLLELRRIGFEVVLDDFGSGFASIEQVLRLPVDGIKLDRTLTAAMDTRFGDAVTRHLVALSRELQQSTVLEGIETSAQADHARRVGAVYGQGYLWSPALSASEMTAYLISNRGSSSWVPTN